MTKIIVGLLFLSFQTCKASKPAVKSDVKQEGLLPQIVDIAGEINSVPNDVNVTTILCGTDETTGRDLMDIRPQENMKMTYSYFNHAPLGKIDFRDRAPNLDAGPLGLIYKHPQDGAWWTVDGGSWCYDRANHELRIAHYVTMLGPIAEVPPANNVEAACMTESGCWFALRYVR